MELNDLVDKVHKTARSKGWWEDGERSLSEIVVLAHSELSEAIEAARSGLPEIALLDKDTGKIVSTSETMLLLRAGISKADTARYKPEGIAVELADCMIRIMDYFGFKEWDLEAVIKLKMSYNETRPHKHGGKAF